MKWVDAEIALRSQIQTVWGGTSFASVPLVFENSLDEPPATYMFVSIEGTYAEKTVYGSTGKRTSIEAGIVFCHAFTPIGSGKTTSIEMVTALTEGLELQQLAGGIVIDGGTPPSPVETGSNRDYGMPTLQPNGSYYRCSGSIPFMVIDSR